jgi:hypothetical protein
VFILRKVYFVYVTDVRVYSQFRTVYCGVRMSFVRLARIQVSLVGIVTDYGLDGRGFMVRFLVSKRYFLLYRIQTGSVAQSAS